MADTQTLVNARRKHYFVYNQAPPDSNSEQLQKLFLFLPPFLEHILHLPRNDANFYTKYVAYFTTSVLTGKTEN